MSFILDALRKSEHDRQRQTGPALAEVAVAAPKSRSNVWAPVAIALLLVNLVVVGVLLIRKAVHTPAATTASVQEPVSTPPSAPPPSAPITTTPVTAPPVMAPPAMTPAAIPAGTTGVQARNPLEAETTDGPPVLDPRMAAHAAAPPPGPPAVTRTPAARGSVVYESLPDSAVVGGPPPGSVPRPGQATAAGPASASGAGLASADELTASGSVPALNLDLHVYSTTPAERLVFINSRKFREGDTLPEGPQIRQITTNGVILTYNGRDYLLSSH